MRCYWPGCDEEAVEVVEFWVDVMQRGRYCSKHAERMAESFDVRRRRPVVLEEIIGNVVEACWSLRSRRPVD